jgi:hypothetical protein
MAKASKTRRVKTKFKVGQVVCIEAPDKQYVCRVEYIEISLDQTRYALAALAGLYPEDRLAAVEASLRPGCIQNPPGWEPTY